MSTPDDAPARPRPPLGGPGVPAGAGDEAGCAEGPVGARRLGRAAASAAARGWFVFPVHPRSKIPAVKRWETAASRDPDQIARWWKTAPFNLGIACGPSGLVVIDIDRPRGDPPPEWAGARGGFDVLARLATEAGETWPPRTTVVQTAGGGSHWYFRAPAGVELRNTQGRAGARGLGWCVDTRGHGGYVLGAGSVGSAGRCYRMVSRHPVATLPDWLEAALTPPPRPQQGRRQPVGEQATPRRIAAYVRAVLDGESAAVAAAQVGERHRTLLAAARRLGHWVGSEVLTEAAARSALTTAAAHYVGVDGYTAAQVERDITDGIAYGARMPRGAEDIPDRSDPPVPHRPDEGSNPGKPAT
jgi:hypothetical protein